MKGVQYKRGFIIININSTYKHEIMHIEREKRREQLFAVFC